MSPFPGTRVDASSGRMTFKPPNIGSLAKTFDEKSPRKIDKNAASPKTADSETVEELLEEGNSFEAGVVFGVENSKNPSVSEVTTHEVPEDDVPDEYLNQD